MTPLFGWEPEYDGIEACLKESEHPLLGNVSRDFRYKKQTTLLYEPILWRWPSWKRGAQGIGDCVSWSIEIACTALLCKEAMRRQNKRLAPQPAATEPPYGGSKVEARGRTKGTWSDGSYVAMGAKWVKKWGVLLRENYGTQTGNEEHDLRSYDSKKAKNWGYYGNGGQHDGGALDTLAKRMPVRDYTNCQSFDDVADAIAGMRVPVCVGSGAGFDMTLDSEGFWRAKGSWAHAMTWLGIRFGKRPGALLCQSWGPRTTKRTENRWPETMPLAVAGCSGWVDADKVDSMCRSGDAQALVGLQGFKVDKFNWRKLIP